MGKRLFYEWFFFGVFCSLLSLEVVKGIKNLFVGIEGAEFFRGRSYFLSFFFFYFIRITPN